MSSAKGRWRGVVTVRFYHGIGPAHETETEFLNPFDRSASMFDGFALPDRPKPLERACPPNMNVLLTPQPSVACSWQGPTACQPKIPETTKPVVTDSFEFVTTGRAVHRTALIRTTGTNGTSYSPATSPTRPRWVHGQIVSR